jgi:hypothetical protein
MLDVDWIHVIHNRGQMSESCEHGNELSDFIRRRRIYS